MLWKYMLDIMMHSIYTMRLKTHVLIDIQSSATS